MATIANLATARHSSSYEPPHELFSRVRAAIEVTPAPTVPTRTRIIIACIVAPCLAGAILAIASQIVYQRQVVGLTAGIHSFSDVLLAVLPIATLVIAVTGAALWRMQQRFENVLLIVIASLAAPAYGILTLAAPLHSPDPFPTPLPLSPVGTRCLTLAMIAGVALLATFAVALRRAIPVASDIRGAAIGAAAGVWAGLVVFAFCPAADVRHLFLGHVVPVAALTLLGLVGIPRLLRP